MRRLIRKRLLDKVCNATMEKNPANVYNKKHGKQQSKRNKTEVPKCSVANNIKVKKVASKSKVGRGKPRKDNDSEGTPEGNKRMTRTMRIMNIMKKRRKTSSRQRTKTNMREDGWRRL